MLGRRAIRFTVAVLAAAVLAAGSDKKVSKTDRGRELVLDVCTYCHELERVTRQRLTKEQWSDVIKGMVSEGAPVTDEEFSLIVEYLAKNFGPQNR